MYRFINEVSDKLKLPLLNHSMGIDPVQLMIKQKIIFSSRMGKCSSILKMKVASDYIKKRKAPVIEQWYNKQYLLDEEFIDNAILYFGISFYEYHRTKAIQENWKPFETEFPLCKMYFNHDDLLRQYKIKKPRLYLKGFTHNNCKGRCVKAGRKHYRLLYNEDREVFEEMLNIENTLQKYVNAWHNNKENEEAKEILDQNEQEMIKWYESKYKYEPNLKLVDLSKDARTIIKGISLEEIKKQQENNGQLDLFEEIGGCGCFVDYDDNEED